MKTFWSLLFVCVFLAGCDGGKGRERIGKFENCVYLWNQLHNEDVRAAIARADSDFDRINFLAAKISFAKPSKNPSLSMVKVSSKALGDLKNPPAMSVRIEGLMADSKTYASLAPIIAELVKASFLNVENKGIRVCEVQIDYDCPESKIPDYALWLKAIRDALNPQIRLSFTALPSQMNARGFSNLAAQADYFTLQIHHLAKRKVAYSIFDSDESLSAARRASKFGKPFNVALPTYSHIAVFDKKNGKLKRAYSENFSGGIDAQNESAVFINSPADEVARLAKVLNNANFKNYAGLIFYRLPCGNEQTNWAYETLIDVKNGKIPLPKLHSDIVESKGALFEVYLQNTGNADAYAPFNAEVENAGVSVFDALNGFAAKRKENGLIFCIGEDSLLKIRPGESLKIGWFRKNKKSIERN